MTQEERTRLARAIALNMDGYAIAAYQRGDYAGEEDERFSRLACCEVHVTPELLREIDHQIDELYPDHGDDHFADTLDRLRPLW